LSKSPENTTNDFLSFSRAATGSRARHRRRPDVTLTPLGQDADPLEGGDWGLVATTRIEVADRSGEADLPARVAGARCVA
jgi:hypothetical protein